VMRTVGIALLLSATGAVADERQLVEMPSLMQQHMMANMRNHLEALDTIVADLAAGRYDAASATAEQRLGMSSLEAHGARRMAAQMPQPMQQFGTAMHRAASRFARRVQEGDVEASLAAFGEVTAACVACHRAYRLR